MTTSMTGSGPELTLDLLVLDDATELLEFETYNREFFARSVGPRPEGYFEIDSLREILRELLAGPDSETDRLYLARNAEHQIVGRANLTNIGVTRPGHGMVGYRVGENFCGGGVATRALAMLLDRVGQDHGVTEVEALVAVTNPASKSVLVHNGFIQLPGIQPVAFNGEDIVLERFLRTL
ncbi:MAG: GNAT family N-acetyltransferase [Acidimicrobiales bacterium]